MSEDLPNIKIDLSEFVSEENAKLPRSECKERKTANIHRRAFSETQLLDLVDSFKNGYSYNFITGGDVDQLSYLKLVLRIKKKLDYCFISTWVMACDDALQIEEWLAQKSIGRIDFYVGEIFKGSKPEVYYRLNNIINKYGGKIVVARNHSKIIAGYKDDFYFVLQSSANVNTNPRIEQAVLTIDKELFDFYFNFFDKLKTIERYS